MRAEHSKRSRKRREGPVCPYGCYCHTTFSNMHSYIKLDESKRNTKKKRKRRKNWRSSDGSARVLAIIIIIIIVTDFLLLAPVCPHRVPCTNLNATQHPLGDPDSIQLLSFAIVCMCLRVCAVLYNIHSIQSSDLPPSHSFLISNHKKKTATQHNSFNKNNVVNKLAITLIICLAAAGNGDITLGNLSLSSFLATTDSYYIRRTHPSAHTSPLRRPSSVCPIVRTIHNKNFCTHQIDTNCPIITP